MSQFVERIYIKNDLYKNLLKIKIHNKNQDFTKLKKIILNCKKKLDKNKKLKAVILSLYPKNVKSCDINELTIEKLIINISNFIGKPLIQNSEKQKFIQVYDRDRNFSMHKGSRYHQTREGGSIHTDNVNIPGKWDYLIFGCLAEAESGGESILVDSDKLYNELKNKFKLAKKILTKNFYWEKRGVSNELYRAPILSFDKKKKPNFRYLRPYLEAAHIRAKKNLTVKQLYAIDTLDALLESSEFQFRFNMKKGDILFNLDSKVLHGRTSFSDSIDSVPVNSIKKKKKNKLKRTMIRAWIKNVQQKKIFQ